MRNGLPVDDVDANFALAIAKKLSYRCEFAFRILIKCFLFKLLRIRISHPHMYLYNRPVLTLTLPKFDGFNTDLDLDNCGRPTCRLQCSVSLVNKGTSSSLHVCMFNDVVKRRY